MLRAWGGIDEARNKPGELSRSVKNIGATDQGAARIRGRGDYGTHGEVFAAYFQRLMERRRASAVKPALDGACAQA
jgi:hypothetical protein